MRSSVLQPEVCAVPASAVDSPRSRVAARYSFRRGEHELILSARDVGEGQIESVVRGEAEFALIFEDSILAICSRFGDAIPWVSDLFCWHLLPREDRVLPDGNGPEERIPLYVSLIDAESGVRRVERCWTLSLDFSRALLGAIREQARTPLDPTAEMRSLARLRRRFPTAESLVSSAIARTIGCL